MFTAKLNNEIIFTNKNESAIREFCRNRLKTEEHLGEIIFIEKDNENKMVFSSEKSSSGNIRMKDITSKYLNNMTEVKEQKKDMTSTLYMGIKSEEEQPVIKSTSKHPRWEIFWKNADGHFIPLSTIVGLDWFTMDENNPKEHQWMEEHGYNTNVLNDILNLPINHEFTKENLSDEWGFIKKIKRLR